MEKYVNKNEIETTAVLIELDPENYYSEIIYAVMASNLMATRYIINKLSIDELYDRVDEMLSVTSDVLIVEVILEAIEYDVFDELNACLSSVTNLNVLRYLICHDAALFDIGYDKSCKLSCCRSLIMIPALSNKNK